MRPVLRKCRRVLWSLLQMAMPPARAGGIAILHRQLQDARGSRTDGQRVVAKLKQRWAQSMGNVLDVSSQVRSFLPHRVALVLGCTVVLAVAGMAGVAGGGTGSSAVAATTKKLTAANWDSAQQQLVLGDGVMSEAPGAGFAGAAPLSIQAGALRLRRSPHARKLRRSLSRPTSRSHSSASTRCSSTNWGSATSPTRPAGCRRAAGLTPPSYFGSEVVARYGACATTTRPAKTLGAVPMERDHARRSCALLRSRAGT